MIWHAFYSKAKGGECSKKAIKLALHHKTCYITLS